MKQGGRGGFGKVSQQQLAVTCACCIYDPIDEALHRGQRVRGTNMPIADNRRYSGAWLTPGLHLPTQTQTCLVDLQGVEEQGMARGVVILGSSALTGTSSRRTISKVQAMPNDRIWGMPAFGASEGTKRALGP
eukprot:275605-Pelagomonas_calceolata.AAC.3